jgi:hypothetical protein
MLSKINSIGRTSNYYFMGIDAYFEISTYAVVRNHLSEII